MTMDFLHAVVAAGLGRAWAEGPIHNDGSPIKPGEGDVEFFGAVNPDASLVGEYCISEVDPVAAKAYADSVNALLGVGFAQPYEPDLDAPPPSPGTPRQRKFTLRARRQINLDERTPGLIDQRFKKGDLGGRLDAFLPDGYPYTPTDAFVAEFLIDLQLETATGGPSAAPKPLAATDVAPTDTTPAGLAAFDLAQALADATRLATPDNAPQAEHPGTPPLSDLALPIGLHTAAPYAPATYHLTGRWRDASGTGEITFRREDDAGGTIASGAGLWGDGNTAYVTVRVDGGKLWVAGLTSAHVTLVLTDLRGTTAPTPRDFQSQGDDGFILHVSIG